MDDYPSFASFFTVFTLVVVNGLFVAAEFSMIRSQATKLKAPELAGKWGIRSSLRLVSDLDLSLSATQLGITVASLTLGWLGEETFQKLFLGLFASIGEPYARYLSHGAGTIIALVMVTFLHVVIGELLAKSVAIRFPELTLRMLSGPVVLFSQLCRPLIFILNRSASLVLRAFGLPTSPASERVHSPGELAMLISHSTEFGVLDKEEEEMLKGIFGFSETIAREVMTPRTDLVTIPKDVSLPEIIGVVNESGLSRFPVVGEGVDDVLGIVLARDVLSCVPEYMTSNNKRFELKRLLREPYFIPGTKPIDDLLNEFKRRKLHMAIVLDEHGGVDGVVTLEDLIEEIVGDIFDESDIAERSVEVIDNGDLLIDGGLLVDDLNDRFQLQVPEGDYDTIAGFILSSLGRMAKVGDNLTVTGNKLSFINGEPAEGTVEQSNEKGGTNGNGSHPPARSTLITVEQVAGNRIETVRIHPLPLEEDESDEEVVLSHAEGEA